MSDIVLHLSTKFHKNRSNGLRVIASRTDRQTDRLCASWLSYFGFWCAYRIGNYDTRKEFSRLKVFFYRDETNISRLIRRCVLPFMLSFQTFRHIFLLQYIPIWGTIIMLAVSAWVIKYIICISRLGYVPIPSYVCCQY